ncbi:C-type lectin domain family 4 member E-like isoform X1 [Sphaeramia orbicularis]|uniref:C-type lectin domain family 4 member E-like isoform X1 n=1 Tax=Sphaeramia orbicularis TaxID=375764 RepID=UPI0011816AD4|nr:C-type lectin domain family 4 member E-like isoform X1 [Sphaeramia orbicularis]
MEGTFENMKEILLPPQTASQGSKTGLYKVLLCLGLICASFLIGIIILGVLYSNSVHGVTNNDRIPTETTPCPPEWMMFQDRCYLLSSITGPWETGNQDCRARGAHLMIINSTEEQEYISSFKDEIWIGLNDIETERTWKWVDGSPITLSFWDAG